MRRDDGRRTGGQRTDGQRNGVLRTGALGIGGQRNGVLRIGGEMTRAGSERVAVRCGDRGMMTLEATVIVPIILMIIMAAILLFLTIGRREALRGEMYVDLYTLEIADEKDGSPADTLSGKADRLTSGSAAVTASSRVIGDELIMTGTVRYLDGKVPAAVARFRQEMPVITMRERDLCSERLRRWQFYGNLTENTGD